jgi:RNA polymerase sigma-70 factor (ECF subfamily)
VADRTDAELVAEIRNGDPEGYSTLVARYQGHVYGLAYSLVNNWADAQDIAQETFIRAYVNLGQLREPGRFAPWLRRVTFGVAMNWLRAYRPAVFQQIEGQVDLDSLDIPDFAPGPQEVVERKELAEAVQRAIKSLPPKYRLPLTMFHLDGLSFQKVADFLDVPLGTAKSLIHRAREKLRVALGPFYSEEVIPMVQEVFNEHKLPAEFSREVWRLCIDWLSYDPDRPPKDATKRKEQAERLVLAAARDPEVALVNAWRKAAEPVPAWAEAVSKELPRWGIEICHHSWVLQMERLIWMIGHETSLPDRAPGECGGCAASRRQWAVQVQDALARWMGGKPAPDDSPGAEIHKLLGAKESEKPGAVQLLVEGLQAVGQEKGEDVEAALRALQPQGALAKEMRGPMGYLEYRCGYRWEKIVLEICRAIGDPEYRNARPLAWHVGACNGQIAFAHRDDPARIPATCAFLVGTWAWLKGVPTDSVRSAYPILAPLAAKVCADLGEKNAVKRWLAGRLFVGIRIWLQEVDYGDLKPPKPAFDVYPTLA